MANAWFDTMDTDKTGRIAQADFAARFASLTAGACRRPRRTRCRWTAGGARFGAAACRGFMAGIQPDDRRLLQVPLERRHAHSGEDRRSEEPADEDVRRQGFEIVDETYTFAQDSFSRQNVRVLTSVDYDKMRAGDQGDGAGRNRADRRRLRAELHPPRRQGPRLLRSNGHNEKIYAIPGMLEHVLAGLQYALGDLKADDTPSARN